MTTPPWSRLRKRWTSRLDHDARVEAPRRPGRFKYCVDQCNTDAVIGWVTHPAGIRRIAVRVDGREIGEATLGLPRPDVAQAEGHAHGGATSGFAFAFPSGAFGARRGEVIVSIEFQAADGRRTTFERQILPLRVRAATRPCSTSDAALAPFPCDVVGVLRQVRPDEYGSTGRWPADTLRHSIEDLSSILAQRAPARPVIRYALYLNSMATTFHFISEHFDRINRLSAPSLKDSSAIATSPEEMLCIANHLYVLRSYGLTDSLVECGCFKGFSSCCLSHACAALGMRMDIFDSFAGLPPSDSAGYAAGEFHGAIEEVEDNLRAFGRPEIVSLHRGFFSETLPGFDGDILSIWMDVDLRSSATDVMQLLPRLPRLSCVFTHECPPECFRDGQPVRDSTEIMPPIMDAFAADGRDITGQSPTGALGALWDTGHGLPVLDLGSILALTRAG